MNKWNGNINGLKYSENICVNVRERNARMSWMNGQYGVNEMDNYVIRYWNDSGVNVRERVGIKCVEWIKIVCRKGMEIL